MTMLAPTSPPRTDGLARAPVLAIAGATAVVLGVASVRGTYFFDELYFLMAGREHLAWGYFDQPPLVPALAALMDHLAPGSLLAFRLPATLSAAAMVVLAAAIARELGGARGAQVLAAAATAMSATTLASHWLATYTLDPLWWTAIAWLLARWTRTRDDRLLLVAGIVTGLSLNTKFLVPALWAGLLVGVALCGPRELLRRPALWLGGLVAVAMAVPTLLWQAGNGWPYVQMNDVVRAEFEGPAGFATGAALMFGPVGLVLAVIGIVRWRRGRFLVVAAVLLFVAFLVLQGRSLYVLSVVPALVAVGSVELTEWARGRARITRGVLGTAGFAASGVLVLATLPLLPQPVIDAAPALPVHGIQAGEQAMLPAAAVAQDLWAALPPAERDRTAVVAQIYPLAAAIESAGVPTWSPHRGYGYFDPPPAGPTDVLWLGFEPPTPAIQAQFAACTERRGSGEVQVWSCTGRRGEWEDLWPTLRTR